MHSDFPPPAVLTHLRRIHLSHFFESIEMKGPNPLTNRARDVTKRLRDNLFYVDQLSSGIANGIRISMNEMEAGRLSGLDVLLATARCLRPHMPVFWQEMNRLFETVLPHVDWANPTYIIDGEEKYASFDDFYARECETWMGPLDEFRQVVRQHQTGVITDEQAVESPPLMLLQRAWRKASPEERQQFLAWTTD